MSRNGSPEAARVVTLTVAVPNTEGEPSGAIPAVRIGPGGRECQCLDAGYDARAGSPLVFLSQVHSGRLATKSRRRKLEVPVRYYMSPGCTLRDGVQSHLVNAIRGSRISLNLFEGEDVIKLGSDKEITEPPLSEPIRS
jgi:hypothetical protein